jgi:chemotaxis protein methyltransferase CheR
MFQDIIDDKQLTDGDFKLFRDYVHENCGIYFEDNKMYLMQNRLSHRLNELGIKSFRDYYYHVKYDNSRQEFNNLINLITTNETSFFRNEPQLESFTNDILPLVIKEKMNDKSKTLKIWSAGCSSGEEPYTLAMVLVEKLKSTNFLDIQIFANDISRKVLQTARQGEYHENRLSNVKPEIIKKYFSRNGQNYKVNQDIKKLINFSQMNLNDHNQFVLLQDMDFVFCRNVMIYFSRESKKKLVRNFYDIMKPGGYLYLGHSETLHGISKAFKLKFYNNCLTYQKEKHFSAKTNLRKDEKEFKPTQTPETCKMN